MSSSGQHPTPLGRTVAPADGGAFVSALSVTAVKGTRLRLVETVRLTRTGVQGDRRFMLADSRGRMINGKLHGQLCAAVAEWEEASSRLRIELPGGRVAEGIVVLGEERPVRFYSRTRRARVVAGPWAQALGELIGEPVTLLDAGSAVDRGRGGAVSVISRGSLRRLAAAAGVDAVDARRFRMTVEIDGTPPHAEDGWVGRVVRIGAAAIRVGGHVGRCNITARDPRTGTIDLDTLGVLREYRSAVPSTEPLPFGVFGEVVGEGAVSVGDRVVPEPEGSR